MSPRTILALKVYGAMGAWALFCAGIILIIAKAIP